MRLPKCDGALQPGDSLLNRIVRAAWLTAGAALVLGSVLMLGFFRLFYDTRRYRYRLFRTKADPKTTESGSAHHSGLSGSRPVRPQAVSFRADPNPVILYSETQLETARLTWNVSSPTVGIFADSPSGRMVCSGGSSGAYNTAPLEHSAIYYLKVASGGDFRTPDMTLARLELAVRPPGPVTFTADPNPAHVSDGSGSAVVTLHWNAPDVALVEIRVNAPDGPLMATGGNCMTLTTDQWVRDGMVFFLQDVSRAGSRITIGRMSVAVIDPVHDEWVRMQKERHSVSVPDAPVLYGLKRIVVTFSPQSVRPGESYRVSIPGFADKAVDVGYELVADQHPEPVIGVVNRWCELDSRGEASILTPAGHAAGIVRITRVRSQARDSGWHPAEGEIRVAGAD